MVIASEAERILKILDNYGAKAYVVGKYVRNNFLGIDTDDITICTNISIKEFKILARKKRLMVYMEDYTNNTAVVCVSNVDITLKTYTTDTIEETLMQNMFTVDAMAMSLNKQLIDPSHGRKDLTDRTLRLINADTTETNILSAILQTLSLISELGFSVDDKLEKFILDSIASSEETSSTPYLQDCMLSIFKNQHACKALEFMFKVGISKPLLGIDLSNKLTLFKNVCELYSDFRYRIACLYYEEDPEALSRFIRLFNIPDREKIGSTIEVLNNNVSPDDRISIKLLLSEHGDLIPVLKFKELVSGTSMSGVIETVQDIDTKKEVYRIKQLNIHASEMKELGIEERHLEKVANECVIAIIKGEVNNTLEDLKNFCKDKK